MAIILNQKTGNMKIILQRDDAINVTDEQYQEYLKSDLDESKLTFVDTKQPTRWVMSRMLEYKEQQNILNEQIEFKPGKRGKMEQKINIGFVFSEIKAALVDIENPLELPEDQKIIYKRDSDNTTNEKLMEVLASAGIVMELYAARTTVLANKGNTELLKKS